MREDIHQCFQSGSALLQACHAQVEHVAGVFAIAVTEAGGVFSGPLFVMEKMPAGFNPKSGDWRYTMIMPDGSLMGVNGGAGSARMEFCVTCHAVVGRNQDHMFYVPEDVRAQVTE